MKENAREPSAVLSCDKRQHRAGEKPGLGQVHRKPNLRTIQTRSDLRVTTELLISPLTLYKAKRKMGGREGGIRNRKEERTGQGRGEERGDLGRGFSD